MKHILIIHAHWNNRGDEAAVRAIIDELRKEKVMLNIQIVSPIVYQFPYEKQEVNIIPLYPRFRNILEFLIGCIFKGKLVWTMEGQAFFNALRDSDLVIHAPGGPSLGDTYYCSEILYLLRFMAVLRENKKFVICAPSVGPFNKRTRNWLRKKIFSSAKQIVLREEISQMYLNQLLPQNSSKVTLDAAFQSKIPSETNELKLHHYKELEHFMSQDGKIVGMTITNLLWHPKYGKEKGLAEHISLEFENVVKELRQRGYRILFIPQLFGIAHDNDYMRKFEVEGCFTMSEEYDCYFQQYIIGKMFALIGMRYHSNIFSAKMGIPFISISYEQKIEGFINKINYQKYCIDIKKLTAKRIIDKFTSLEKDYDSIKRYLDEIGPELRSKSYETTEILLRELRCEA